MTSTPPPDEPSDRPERGRKPRWKREGRPRPEGRPGDLSEYWTRERVARARPPRTPRHPPVRHADFPRDTPYLLDPAAPDPFPRVPRHGRPVCWLLPADRPGPAAVRHGLRRLLAAELGEDGAGGAGDPAGPTDAAADPEPCPACGLLHGLVAGHGPRRVHLGYAREPGAVLFALSDTPVGVALVTSADAEDEDALRAARLAARRLALERAAERGRCGPGRPGRPAHDLAYVAVPPPLVGCVVWQEARPREAPVPPRPGPTPRAPR
ncbi:hypothetical protein [Streptomyces sp. bgisy154]|uniref:hypothetical protein n=1 Tax=Streptomyces sp. bgisy154 TaxID=3413794 RepID=UPI003D742A61